MDTQSSVLTDAINRLDFGVLYELRRGLVIAGIDKPDFSLKDLESLLDQRQEELRERARGGLHKDGDTLQK